METKLLIGYETATYEKEGKVTEYLKWYVRDNNGYKHPLKWVNGLSKEQIKDVIDNNNK